MIQLFNADCLEKLKDISSNSIDLVICDLPFGCLEVQKRSEESIKKYNRARQSGVNSGCSWDIKIDLEPFWKEIKRIRKNEHTPTLHFCTTKYGYELIKSNEKEFRYDLVWAKTNGVGFLSANKMPMRSHEMVYVFSKAGAYYNRIDISGNFPRVIGGVTKSNVYGITLANTTRDNEGKRCPTSILTFSNKKKKQGHPTEKPVELYNFLIERYCPVGGTVLDPTFGSCNSGKACKLLGRNYIGIEKDKGFYDKAVDAMKD